MFRPCYVLVGQENEIDAEGKNYLQRNYQNVIQERKLPYHLINQGIIWLQMKVVEKLVNLSLILMKTNLTNVFLRIKLF